MRKYGLLCSIVSAVIFISACSSEETKVAKNKEPKSEDHGNYEIATNDVREETSGTEQLPEFLKDKPEDMRIVYMAAAKNQELLENIPCYCGCGESANHKNNYDCFIYENKEDGTVIWDDHGTKCGVCLEIAAQSVSDFINGKSVKEIRSTIDEQYKEGYAKPTPTPEV